MQSNKPKGSDRIFWSVTSALSDFFINLFNHYQKCILTSFFAVKALFLLGYKQVTTNAKRKDNNNEKNKKNHIDILCNFTTNKL